MSDITKIKVDGEPESSYKLFPKNREFEKRAGGNTGSQSVVQSDWNQNDETQPDYVKNRPFYTGDPVETVLVEESTVPFSDFGGGIYQGKFSSTFAPTIGETYKVSWDGTVYECVCASSIMQGAGVIGNASITGAGSDSGEPFVMIVPGSGEIIIGSTEASDSHTISISGFVPEVVKIDEKYLPDTVATMAYVKVAQSTAENAQSTAENAQSTANTAKTTANTAKTTAENAQSTANTAKTTAENAQTTANTALERAVEPYTGKVPMAPLYKNGGFSAWCEVVQQISYNKTEGYFFANSFDKIALKIEDMPDGVFCADVYVGNQIACAFLSKSATDGNRWFVAGFAVIIGRYYRTGEVLYVSSNTISQNEAKGLFLTFRAPDSMLLKSSTADSTKQFRITVDDSGALTATEVT